MVHACRLLAVVALALWWSAAAQAQAFPVRPLRLIYVFTGGGVSDLLARVTAQKMGEALGQPVVVENKPGAGGLIGTREVLRAQPPGYTLLFATTGLVGNLHAYRDPQYRLEDFVPVGVVGEIPYVMIVHDAVGAKSLAQLIAQARARPGQFNYGSIGPSSGATILAERLKQAADIDLVMVPFKGGEPASVALYAGDIHVYFATLGVARQRMKNPRILGLATTAVQRTAAFPDIPSFRELGYPVMDMGTWHALFAAAGTPRPVQQRLQAAARTALASAELRAQLEKNDEEPWTGTLEAFTARLQEESARIGEDYRRLGLPVQD